MRTFSALCTLSIVALISPAASFCQTRNRPVHRAAKPSPEPELPPVDLPSEPGLYAVFYTSMGNIVCRLFEKEAPKTVANFVSLAKGTKPWTNPQTGKRMRTALYSDTTFHRIIPDFMIQGGDPIGTGEGSPGFKFEDEISPTRTFEGNGILAMANSGPNTNGSQFFITVAPATHLNGHHTIFGEVVSGQDVADAISKVPRDDNDKPLTPVKLIRVVIRTVPAAAPPTE